MSAPETRVLDGPHGPLRVRVYRAAEATGAALVWAHGGGFAFGDLDMPEADWVARTLAAGGFPVVSVDYRLAPVAEQPGPEDEALRSGVRFPVAADELAFALDWARDHAAELGVDPGRIALGGASAGGNLAAGAIIRLLAAGRTPPVLAVLAYPTLHAVQPDVPEPLAVLLADAGLGDQFSPDVLRRMYENYLGGPVEGAPIAAAPGTATAAELAGFPRTVIVTSEIDELRVSGEAFADVLRAAGIEVDLVTEAGATHGHLNRPDEGPHAEATVAVFASRLARL